MDAPKSGYAVAATKTMARFILTEIIITRTALPIPPDYEFLGDVMREWGRTKSAEWERTVTRYVWEILSGTKPAPPTKRELYTIVIGKWVKILMKKHGVYVGDEEAEAKREFLFEWLMNFEHVYKHKTEDFREVAMATYRWFQVKLDALVLEERALDRELDVLLEEEEREAHVQQDGGGGAVLPTGGQQLPAESSAETPEEDMGAPDEIMSSPDDVSSPEEVVS